MVAIYGTVWEKDEAGIPSGTVRKSISGTRGDAHHRSAGPHAGSRNGTRRRPPRPLVPVDRPGFQKAAGDYLVLDEMAAAFNA